MQNRSESYRLINHILYTVFLDHSLENFFFHSLENLLNVYSYLATTLIIFFIFLSNTNNIYLKYKITQNSITKL